MRFLLGERQKIIISGETLHWKDTAGVKKAQPDGKFWMMTFMIAQDLFLVFAHMISYH